MSQPFDFDKALKALQSGQALTGKDGLCSSRINIFSRNFYYRMRYSA
ncbi:hypothetical protein EK69_001097 [Salmonella enterica subsp. enterica]|nr:hypothetical protein [Salmonella enterica subsp. enterica serovar Baguida]